VIDDVQARKQISDAIGSSLDDLVRDRMTGLVEEPDITSRVGQRLEDRFDGQTLGGYRVRVISETITSHGPKSLEKPMGTDLYFAVEVEGSQGVKTSKGILVQAKRFDRLAGSDLAEQCRRMNLITKKGSVVWIYTPSGITVALSSDVERGSMAPISNSAFFDGVLECSIGDKRKVPDGAFGNRRELRKMLEALGAENAVWLALDQR
jgi:hypothetical protein